MWLLIDDMRDLGTDAIARNAQAGIAMLTAHKWECVCFDHDLGEQESGYDVMKWMLGNAIFPPRIQLVTSNPVGRKNMAFLLDQYNYESKDNANFYLKS